MEGLIALLLISWIVSAIGKKKKVKKTANPAAAKPAARSVDPAQNREARIAQMRQELDRRKAEMQKQEESRQISFLPEGISAGEAGSMNFDSTEGECICDPELEHERIAREDPQSVYAQEIGTGSGLDFSAQGMKQAIIMSEVLARPAQRFARKY